MSAYRARILILLTTLAAASVMIGFGMHYSVPYIGFWRDIDRRDHFSLEYWTVETYCWAAVAVFGFVGYVVASIVLIVSLAHRPKSHGFPIR
jgi:hypothetical protein